MKSIHLVIDAPHSSKLSPVSLDLLGILSLVYRDHSQLSFYRDSSGLHRNGQLRNGDPEIGNISISSDDMAALTAFLE